ncbi:MAG: ATP-binding cassette domain-containing protein [Oscillospiraceae bacterium]|nr:ATP-binding cassette domain-containing protein [Oscillospiraceae bacterium]
MFVEARHLNKRFDDYEAAKDISFGVEQGKMAALLGPSGGGKTTILRMIAGLEQQDSGDILIDGKNVNEVPAGERGIGFVFQNYALFRYMNVYDNIAFGLKVQKKSKAEIRARVTELIQLIGLNGLEKRYPNQLSGGQRQRVAFARAIAPGPGLLLLDEPFAAIDAKVRKELRVWLRDMIVQVGITSIFVTHDQEEALEVADDIIILNEGRIEQMGTPTEIYLHPKTPFVAQFAGNSSVVENLSGFRGFEGLPTGRKILIRPEFVEAFKKGNPQMQAFADRAEDGVVTGISFRGNSLEVRLEVHGITLVTNRSLERREIHLGEHMNVFLYRVYCMEEGCTQVVENERLKGVSVE